jgi:hypothetical protein
MVLPQGALTGSAYTFIQVSFTSYGFNNLYFPPVLAYFDHSLVCRTSGFGAWASSASGPWHCQGLRRGGSKGRKRDIEGCFNDGSRGN